MANETTKLISRGDSLLKMVVENFPSYKTGYAPTFWCFNAFMSTATLTFMQRCVKIDCIREILKTPDCGQFSLDWVNEDGKNNVIVLIVPGINSSSKSNYISHVLEKATKADCKAVVINHRGIECDLATPRTYCALNTDDLELAIAHIKIKYANHKIVAVGFSLGGIQLGRFLSSSNNSSDISYAMIVSAPFNVFSSVNELNKPNNYMIHKFVVRSLLDYGRRHKHLFENNEKYNLDTIFKSKSFHDLVEHFLTKQSGLESWEDYYKEACLDTKLDSIKVPTLFLNASDDMFSPHEALPIQSFTSNPNIALMMTKYGGHISFVEGLYPTGCNYVCRVFSDYLNHVILEQKATTEIKESSKPHFDLL